MTERGEAKVTTVGEKGAEADGNGVTEVVSAIARIFLRPT